MRLFNKVAIVGVGLIGGSLALGIKKKKLSQEVIGFSRHKSTLLWAKKKGAIDRGSQQLGVIRDADLVILATPVSLILKLAPIIRKLVKPQCIVSDVGSTKREIVSKLERLFPNYVGSHPLAGSEKRGIMNASSDIFKNSLCILTPTGNTSRLAKEKIKRLWNSLGARVAYLPAAKHDEILSFVSHLPHLAAFVLIGTVPQKYLRFSSGGLKDSTRIASSDPELWSDIFLSNKKNMLETLGCFEKNLNKIKSAIKRRDKKNLLGFLKEAKKKKESLAL